MRDKSFLILTMTMAYLLFGCNGRKKSDPFVLPKDLTTISVVDSLDFNPEWYDYKYKVAVFIKNAGSYSTLDLNWNDPIKEFPEIAFLFYIAEKDSNKLVDHLRDVGFSHPIIYDPKETFYKNNVMDKVTFISYLLKDDVYVEMSNPSFPDFGERLGELVK